MSLSYQNLPDVEIVTNLIFDLYGITLPAASTFAVPVGYAPSPGDVYQRDTTVLVTMPPNDPVYSGQATLNYSRLDLGVIDLVGTTVIETPNVPFMTYDILDQINTVYGLSLTEADVVNTTYTEDQGPFILTASATSLAWKNTLALTVDLQDLPSLASLVSVTALGGLTYAPLVSPIGGSIHITSLEGMSYLPRTSALAKSLLMGELDGLVEDRTVTDISNNILIPVLKGMTYAQAGA